MRLLRLAPWLVLSLARGGAAAAAAWRDLNRRNSPADLMNDAARGLTDAQVKALELHLGSPLAARSGCQLPGRSACTLGLIL